MKKINKIMSFALALTITAGVAAGTVVTGAEYDINNEAAAFSEPVADAAEADENGFIIENNILTGYTGTGGSITIPDTVFTIGSKAFKDNKAITRVTIPDSVLKIESSAFSGCTGITKVNFGKSVTSIGSEAFYGCTSLTEAMLPEGLLTAECVYPYNGVFTDCTSLKKVYIPSTLNSAARLFKNCSALDGSEVTFGEGIIKLPDGLFRSCTGLKTITLPETLTSISSSLFMDCTNLTGVSIPDSVTEIGESAFSNCELLSKVNFGKGLTKIGSEAFYGCKSLTEAMLPEGLLTAECVYPYNGVFTGCTALKKVYIPSTLNSAARMFKNCSALDGSEVTFGAGIIKLPGSLFRECSGLKTITLPETLTSISSSLFMDCTNLTGVSIPDSVTEIGESAFSNCELLSKVNFGKGLTKIGSEAFYGCKSLTEAILPEGLLTAECVYPYNGVFTGCTALTKVYIPSTLNSAARMFKNCSSLDGSKVTFGTGTVKLPDGLFRECTGLKTITLPETLRTVSDYLFYDCAKLSGVTIPNSTASIGKCAFYNCKMLAKVNFGTGLTKIGSEAFYGCTSLTEIYLPEGLTTAECVYPYNGVFTNNTSLRAVDFPLSLTDAKNIFKGCTNLYDIYYNGSKEQWDKIDLGTESLPEAAVIHYNGYRVQAVESITVSALPTKTVYKKGEALDVTGGKITVKYEGDKADEIINITAAMCTGFDSKTAGTKTITVTYNGKTATFTVTVEDSGTPDPVEEGTVIEVGTGKDCTGLTAALTTINNAVKKKTADTAYTLILTDKTYTEKKALAFPAVKVIIKGDEGTVVTAPSVTSKGDLVLENITLKTAKGAAAAVTAKKSLTATNSTLGKTTATGDAVLDNCTVGVLTAKGSLTIDGGSFEAVTVSAKKGTTTLNNTVNIAKNLTVSNDLVIVGNSTVGGKFTAKAGLNINGFIVKNGK